MKNSNDLFFGVVIGAGVCALVFALTGFPIALGRDGFVSILVAIGTIGATFGAFWGVRAARQVQQREWQRQDELAAVAHERKRSALIASTYHLMMRAGTGVLRIAEETGMLHAQLQHAKQNGTSSEIEDLESACVQLGRDSHLTGAIATFLPSFEDQIALASLDNFNIEEAARQFDVGIGNALHVTSGMQSKCQTTKSFSERDIRHLKRVALQILLFAESVRVNGGGDGLQWDRLPEVAAAIFPDYAVPKDGLSVDDIPALIIKISDEEQALMEEWGSTKNTMA